MVGVINEQGFPFEDTGAGYSALNEKDQATIKRSAPEPEDIPGGTPVDRK